MKSILIDAGPIIALYRKNDLYHERALEFIKSFRGRLITTWPVITEVMHELYRPDVQEKFLLWIERGGLEIANIDQDSISGLISFIKKYFPYFLLLHYLKPIHIRLLTSQYYLSHKHQLPCSIKLFALH
jgi:predicted nucleic acid-binding protein